MKSIGLMGGTFDPVHYAHTFMAKSAIEELNMEKVIMIPAFIQPFKRDRAVTSDFHRLAMLERSLLEYENIEISTWEIEKKGISYTYDTVMHFKDVYPDYKIWFLMGTDSLLKLENWYKGKDLLKACSFAVGKRPDNDSDELNEVVKHLTEVYETEIYLIRSDMLPFSSTMIRDRLEKDLPISGMVAPSVEEYIYEQGLYKDFSI